MQDPTHVFVSKFHVTEPSYPGPQVHDTPAVSELLRTAPVGHCTLAVGGGGGFGYIVLGNRGEGGGLGPGYTGFGRKGGGREGGRFGYTIYVKLMLFR